MRESDEPLTDTLVRCLADPTDLKALERLENDGDQAGARLMRARLADQAAVRLDAALEDNRARVRRQLGRDWAWVCFVKLGSAFCAVFFRSVGSGFSAGCAVSAAACLRCV
ncbi:hypothetical protein PMS71_08175, partial [Bifidobacterium longum]|nr:hypothetical protein [Bifidobacterium longum]MDB6904921.1 hypothetical protein [Bifidobacterium longum]